jgi:hypothetical protein
MSDEAKRIEDKEIQEILEDLDETDPVNESEPEDENLSDHSRRVLRAASVVPLYDAAAKRGKGRPKKINPKPTRDDLVYHQEVIAQQAAFVDRDEIVRATRNRQSSLETLQLLKERIAIAGANLDFHRVELQKRGVSQKEIPQVISRQIAALKEIANIELEINKYQASVFNLRDERLQKVFSLLIDTFRDVATEMLPAERFDLLWNRLETALEGWEEKAESLVR